MPKLYHYVGPDEIRARSVSRPCGQQILTSADLHAWVQEHRASNTSIEVVAATFVIDIDGHLRLADRHSEHVACAGGGPVLSAGEMFFSIDAEPAIEEVSNLSTGFCPEAESWASVRAALDEIAAPHPGRFTMEITFRRCESCGERNVIKDSWFVCDVCGADLPEQWNFAR